MINQSINTHIVRAGSLYQKKPAATTTYRAAAYLSHMPVLRRSCDLFAYVSTQRAVAESTCKKFAMSLALVWMLIATSFVHADEAATDAVRSTVLSVVATLKDTSLSEPNKKAQVAAIVAERFDFESMTSRVLATNWKRASAAEKRKITGLFQAMLTDTYWRKFSAFSDHEVEFLAVQTRSADHVSYQTLIKSKTTNIPVDYKLYRVGGTWMAYDVVIEQVSLVRNYRGKFQTIVRNDGIGGLIRHLEKSSP